MHTGEKLGLEWSIVFGGNTPSKSLVFFVRKNLLSGKDDLTWREVLEDKGGEVLGDNHHLTPGPA